MFNEIRKKILSRLKNKIFLTKIFLLESWGLKSPKVSQESDCFLTINTANLRE